MVTKPGAEKNGSTRYLLNTIEVHYGDCMGQMEEIVHNRQEEIDYFGRMREKAEEGGRKLAVLQYSKSSMGIYEKTLNTIDPLELAGRMRESVIFFIDRGCPPVHLWGEKETGEA